MKKRFLAKSLVALVGLMGGIGLGLAALASAGPAATAAVTVSEAPSSDCPPPALAPGTPTPTSVGGPEAVTPTAGSASVGEGSALGAPVCQWVYDLPSPAGDPTVTFTYLGTEHMALSSSYAINYSGYYGVSCNMHVEVLNGFGGGGAQETLNSGNCNTDGYTPGESSVQVVGSGYHDGPVDSIGSFNSTVTSFESGYDVFFGVFTACSQNPVGQHSTYNCDYFDGGPLF